jgi:hypothetical protein
MYHSHSKMVKDKIQDNDRMKKRGSRRPRYGSEGAAPPSGQARPLFRAALLLFALSLVVRLLFWRAAPDATWPYSAFFKGDALVWLDYAQSLRAGVPFELGLPIHPPGTGYLLSWLWDGRESGLALLRFAWCLLGAAAVALFFASIARSFGTVAAWMAGGLMAASTGLLVLSSSLNAETPYLVLVAGSFVLFEDLLPRPRTGRLVAWSVLQGVACLFRVEHVLFVVLVLALLAGSWWRSIRSLRPLAIAVMAVAAPLLPWHAQAWSAIARFNQVEPEGGAARRLETPPGLTWDPAALARRGELPAFARPTAAAFVAATVAHRGGREVRAEDFATLEEAFGYAPRPLARFPFVSSYGPLNFALANNARAEGGFSPALLEEPPTLQGGPSRYPPALVAGLPPPQLALVYPPHLRLFNEGYSTGAAWVLRNPGSFARLAWRKLQIFWSGAALGFTGYGFPLGASGVRRAVDLAVPDESPWAAAWRLGVLAACAAGAMAGSSRLAVWPWLLFLLSKVVTTVLFFGYARLGATVVPVVALLAALAVERWVLPRLRVAPGRGALVAIVAAVVLVGAEAARCWLGPRVRIDGREVSARDPVAADVYRDQRVEVR